MKNIFVRYTNDKGQKKSWQGWKADSEIGPWIANLKMSQITEIKIVSAAVDVLPTQAEREARGAKDGK